jgi:hypothetical protein
MNLASKVLMLLEEEGMALPKDFTVKGFQAKLIAANKKMTRQISELSKKSDNKAKETIAQMQETVKENSESIVLLNTLSDDLSDLSVETAVVILKQAEKQIDKISKSIELYNSNISRALANYDDSEKSGKGYAKGIANLENKLRNATAFPSRKALEATENELAKLKRQQNYTISLMVDSMEKNSYSQSVIQEKESELSEWKSFLLYLNNKVSPQVSTEITPDLKKQLEKIAKQVSAAQSGKLDTRIKRYENAKKMYQDLGVKDDRIEKNLATVKKAIDDLKKNV